MYNEMKKQIHTCSGASTHGAAAAAACTGGGSGRFGIRLRGHLRPQKRRLIIPGIVTSNR